MNERNLEGVRIGCAMTGSFCTFRKVFEAWRALSALGADLIPIFSENSARTDTRFGSAAEMNAVFREITKKQPWTSIDRVEPIGPKKLLDLLVVAPCTGNTLAKLAAGIADTPVTLAVKSHLRNGRPVLIAVSSNDALGQNAKNIGSLLAAKHFFFVPFRQDDWRNKPNSLVADFSLIPDSTAEALQNRQIQPLLRP